MKRILFVAVILVIMFLSACAANISPSATATNTMTTTTTAIEVTAEALFTSYPNNNTVAADAEYKDKTLQVSGEAMAIGYDSSGTPYVELSGGWADMVIPIR